MIEGFYVYIYSDPRDGVPFYVGKGREYRAYKHLHQTHSRGMRMNLQQLSTLGVEPSIEIVTCENEARAYQLEAMFIAIYGRRCDESSSLFNVLTDGEKTTGMRGKKHSEETKAKISAYHKGRPKSEQMKAKMRIVGLRRDVSHLHSEESRAKLRDVQTSPEYRAKQSAAQKIAVTPERQANITRRAAEVTRGQKQSLSHVVNRMISADRNRKAK